MVSGLNKGQVRLDPQWRWTGVCDLWPVTVTLVNYKLKQQLCNHPLLPTPSQGRAPWE